MDMRSMHMFLPSLPPFNLGHVISQLVLAQCWVCTVRKGPSVLQLGNMPTNMSTKDHHSNIGLLDY